MGPRHDAFLSLVSRMARGQSINEMSGTMQTNGQSNFAPSQRSRRGPRFSLASGDKPLEGYTIKRGVGIGGFGEVYYATSDAGKEVALKRIQRNLEVELRGVTQCLNIKHPNLVSLYDIRYDKDEQAWVVMEYVAGESLQDVIERNPNGMPKEQVHFWFDGISAGVAHLHDCGIVHRDLKPGNIFLDDDVVKIGDYGLSKFISCSRRSAQTQSVGTFHYMAPEIGQGRYGKEIDVYALGIMLYEMVTGRVPFDGESSQEIIMKHLTSEPQLRDVPPPYRDVIAAALTKDPEMRTHSVGEMRTRIVGGKASKPSSSAPYLAAVVGDVASPQAAARPHPSPSPSPTPTSDPEMVLPNEPIAEAIKTAWTDIVEAWKVSDLGSSTKMVIILAIVALLALNSSKLLPFAGSLLLMYVAYVVIRGMVLRHSLKSHRRARYAAAHGAAGRTSAATAPGLATPLSPTAETFDADEPILAQPVPGTRHRRVPRHMRRLRKNAAIEKKRILREAVAQKSTRSWWAELTGSWLMAAIVCCVVTLIAFVMSARDAGMSWFADYTWIASTSTVAAWAVLFTAKRWDGHEQETLSRRFLMMVTGLGVGLISAGIGSSWRSIHLRWRGPSPGWRFRSPPTLSMTAI